MSMSLTPAVLKQHLNPVFIETGTYDGRGARLAHGLGFKTVHTIELDPERAETSRKNLAGLAGVVVHEGDTVEVLPRLLSELEERATIWLDAHPVRPWDTCKVGQVRYPLVRELDLINTCSRRRDHTIIVDDRNDFEKLYGTNDSQVMEKIKCLGPGYTVWIEGNFVIGKAS